MSKDDAAIAYPYYMVVYAYTVSDSHPTPEYESEVDPALGIIAVRAPSVDNELIAYIQRQVRAALKLLYEDPTVRAVTTVAYFLPASMIHRLQDNSHGSLFGELGVEGLLAPNGNDPDYGQLYWVAFGIDLHRSRSSDSSVAHGIIPRQNQ